MSFLEQVGLEHPVVQAGMGGGIAGGRLAGTVSAAGALGTVGTLAPARLAVELEHARARAGDRPVAANLLVPFVTRAHVRACARGGAKLAVLHGGWARALVAELKDQGLIVLHTVGSVAEARRALGEGADGLIVQGREAGGHLVGVEPALEALARVLAVAGGAPVLVAGGIADGEDVRRAVEAGAAAAVAGTRFLLTEESDAHPAYRRRVLDASRTIETRLFGLGWPMRHRVVPNAATDRWCAGDSGGPWAIRVLQPLSKPLARLPEAVTAAMISAQRPGIPLFSPAVPVAGMPERLIDGSALYAGETALRIDAVVPAVEAVALLSGVGAADASGTPPGPAPAKPGRSPTIPSS